MWRKVRAFMFVGGVATVFLATFVFPVAADVELTTVEWSTVGTDVRFHGEDPREPNIPWHCIPPFQDRC